jgi:hypothetical protein
MNTRSLTSIRLGVLALALALVAPAALAQAPQTSQPEMLSSSDVSDEQLDTVAKIAVKTQMATRQQRMKLRQDMKKKYGNPQDMDSTQKAQARREIRKKQMAMRKQTMQTLQEEAKKEGMKASMVQRVLQSARKDSTLKQRLQKAMKAEAQARRSGMKGGQGSGGQGSGGQQGGSASGQ